MKQFAMMIACCLLSASSFAQQQLGQRPRVKSPVINADGTVTFNFYDPSAQRVSVNGDFDEIRNQRLEEAGQWGVDCYNVSSTQCRTLFLQPQRRRTTSHRPLEQLCEP